MGLRMVRTLFALLSLAGLWLSAAMPAHAADVCPTARQQQFSPDIATRITAIACNENMLWYRPFIDANGRVASTTVSEGEADRLGDGTTETWRRVAGYWLDSGLLSRMAGFPGATDCAYAGSDRYPSPACRAFIIDQPWSAAFVSYVMTKAGVPGFRPSASHFDYVRDAYLHPDESAFLYLDPATARPAAGDLLCYVRMPGRTYGYAGLISALGAGSGSLSMHCDIVVAISPGNDGIAYTIGGNVQQGVTMRLLHVNRNGNFWGLPQRNAGDPVCSPDAPSSCNFNRQDWSVLLKLKSPSVLAQLTKTTYDSAQSQGVLPSPQVCCVNCVVGSDVPRCPDSQHPQHPR